MHLKKIIGFVVFLIGHAASGQDTTSVQLLFMGDIMVHDTQHKAAYQSGTHTYDFSESFELIAPEIKKADIAIANLEVTLAGPPYTGFPTFSAPDAIAVAAVNAGIDVMVTANNHACDKWKNGVVRTLNVLDSLGVKHTGTFRDTAEQDTVYPLLIEAKGFRLALLNYTYGTNGIRIPVPTAVNMIDTTLMAMDIGKAHAMHPDMIIVFLHWGDEYSPTPSVFQQQIATFLLKRGVRMVIGSHPHVLQKMVFRNETTINDLVVYSLGNFLSGQRTAPRDGAAMVKVELTKGKAGCMIKDVSYELTYVHYPFIGGTRHFIVVPVWRAELDATFRPKGYQGWGRLGEFAKSARELLKTNTGVGEYYPKVTQ
jgi:poly-gamma-glutamate synthesis protein (capsule biosynthesis protein)